MLISYGAVLKKRRANTEEAHKLIKQMKNDDKLVWSDIDFESKENFGC